MHITPSHSKTAVLTHFSLFLCIFQEAWIKWQCGAHQECWCSRWWQDLKGATTAVTTFAPPESPALLGLAIVTQWRERGRALILGEEGKGGQKRWQMRTWEIWGLWERCLCVFEEQELFSEGNWGEETRREGYFRTPKSKLNSKCIPPILKFYLAET